MIIILVQPQMAENIGMVARAMMNCGLTELRLVAPRDGWPNAAAIPAASGAVSIIENAKAYETVAAAVADCHYVYASTARLRDQHKPLREPQAAMADTQQRQAAGQQVALLFGPERTGLSNDDLAFANGLVTVPLNPAYTSLNLAQAVLLLGWEWWQRQPAANLPTPPATPIATASELEHFLNRFINALDGNDFFTTAHQKPAMVQNLRNIFLRNDLTAQEVRSLQGVLTALQNQN